MLLDIGFTIVMCHREFVFGLGKKIKNMKTIEERADDIANTINPQDRGIKDGYIIGANQQKAIDIDKACEWLKKHCGMNDSGLVQFRKAMEEEI